MIFYVVRYHDDDTSSIVKYNLHIICSCVLPPVPKGQFCVSYPYHITGYQMITDMYQDIVLEYAILILKHDVIWFGDVLPPVPTGWFFQRGDGERSQGRRTGVSPRVGGQGWRACLLEVSKPVISRVWHAFLKRRKPSLLRHKANLLEVSKPIVNTITGDHS